MTDEGRVGDPMDETEMRHAIAALAVGARALWSGLREQGFSEAECLKLTQSWLHGISGGKQE